MKSEPIKRYFSKILLTGEYLIMDGSPALAIPFERYSGFWDFSTTKDERLMQLIPYLKGINIELDIAGFESDIQNGLFFNSNIPFGYGCGSSGALVAAVYDKYHKETSLKAGLVKKLANIESFYHGNSSGIDPYVAFKGSVTLIKDNEVTSTHLRQGALDNLYLIDTGQPRETSPLVKTYNQIKAQKGYQKIKPVLIEINSAIINNFLSKDETNKNLEVLFKKIARLQKEHMAFAFPDVITQEWEQNLEEGNFVKLCGAGGGGFFMVYSNNPKENWIPLTKI